VAAAEVAAEDALQQEIVQNAESTADNEGFDCMSDFLQQRASLVGGVQFLLDAFPHCDMIYVDISTPAEQQWAVSVINTLAGDSSWDRMSSAGGRVFDPSTAALFGGGWSKTCTINRSVLEQACRSSLYSEQGCSTSTAAAAANMGEQQQQLAAAKVLQMLESLPLQSGEAQQQERRRPRLCLSALQRSYHCPANKVRGIDGVDALACRVTCW
jgi:hypothetical protein